jgi:hypothetical protein
MIELLTVMDRFQIQRIGVILVPDFSVPRDWANLSEQVTVVTPEGASFKTLANLNLAHFNISDPEASIDKRWRIAVSLPAIEKDTVPVGSKILVSESVKNAIFHDEPA